MSRWILVSIVSVAVATFTYLGLAIYHLDQGDAPMAAVCTVDSGGVRIPRTLCEWWLPRSLEDASQREKDATFHAMMSAASIHKHAPEQRQRALVAAKVALSKGAYIDSVDFHSDLTGLHATVLARDVALAGFLLEQGADPSIEENGDGMTPLALAQHLQAQSSDDPKLQEIIKLLQQQE